MATVSTTRFTGLQQMQAVLRGLPTEMRAVLLADAVTAAVAPIKRLAKTLAPRDTGALAASIEQKTVNNPERGTAMAMVGPDRNYYRGGKQVGKHESRQGADKPANYAHLLEFGHIAVQPRKGRTIRRGNATKVGFVPARPFIRPALIMGEPEIEQLLAEGLTKGIERARQRLAGNG